LGKYPQKLSSPTLKSVRLAEMWLYVSILYRVRNGCRDHSIMRESYCTE